ncbi:MAG: hypothetical protein ACTHNG_04175 [Ginsengibacter sp.]
MKKSNVVAGAIAGTAAMTLFSYFLSGKKDKDFREPALLGKMAKRVLPPSEKTVSEIAGWMMHGSMGLFFAWTYQRLPEIRKMYPDLPDDIFVGVVNGVIGVVLWKLVFSLHPDPPKIDFKRFYQHLILAHIIFSTTTLSVMDDEIHVLE